MTTKENIIAILKFYKPELLKFGVQNIGLFGSYVRGEQSSRSDIDLLIDFEPDKENFDNYMAVYDIVEHIFKDQKVEVVTKNGLSKYIGPKILKDVLYV
jgi:predicted nucleotidyltransferase